VRRPTTKALQGRLMLDPDWKKPSPSPGLFCFALDAILPRTLLSRKGLSSSSLSISGQVAGVMYSGSVLCASDSSLSLACSVRLFVQRNGLGLSRSWPPGMSLLIGTSTARVAAQASRNDIIELVFFIVSFGCSPH